MTKIVNSWNEWDPLKRVIVGRPDGSQIPAPEPAWDFHAPNGGFPLGSWGLLPQEMVDAANEQMDGFVKMMEKRGIIVDRVDVHPSMLNGDPICTPDWAHPSQRGISNPRDLFLPVGNEIMEATGCMRARWYEYLALRPLFEQYFKDDPEFVWTSAPRPRLTDESYDTLFNYKYRNVFTQEEKLQNLYNWQFQLTDKEPLWDAADADRAGKDIFWQCSAVTNRAGMDWLKRYFTPKGIRIHPITFDTHTHPWHLDCNLTLVRPGLAIYNPVWPIITENALELFRVNDWELVAAAPPTHIYKSDLTLLGGEYTGPSWISMNTFALGPKTICVEAHETAYLEQLDKMGIEVVPVPYNDVCPFGGALHCTTLDVYREGVCEDYFPKQIPGY